jgi:hypothetical protein
MQVTGGADLFIGFGGVVERTPVAAEADWYVYKYSQLIEALKRYTVSVHKDPGNEDQLCHFVRLTCVGYCLAVSFMWYNYSQLIEALKRW